MPAFRRFILLGSLVAPLAHAVNWVQVAADGEPGDRVVALADTDTVRERNGLRQAWVRYDFDRPPATDGPPHLSAQLFMHYDCPSERATFSRVQMFSEPGGTGRLVLDKNWPAPRDTSELKADRAGSLAHQVLRKVCTTPPRR